MAWKALHFGATLGPRSAFQVPSFELDGANIDDALALDFFTEEEMALWSPTQVISGPLLEGPVGRR